MNYRHAYHAGNFADVVKHIALVGVLTHLRKKETAFAVIDTHAGRGLYDLKGDEASRTGEAGAGIERLRGSDSASAPDALSTYLKLAGAWGDDRYPGSPLIAARLLRPQDRLVAIEKHPEEEAALARALQPFPRARVVHADAFERLPALLPPQERRGLVLIDPPYESPTDFHDAARAVAAAIRRFPTGIYMIWFPVKSEGETNLFCGEVLAGGVAKALRIDVTVAADARDDKARMNSAGLLLINPPYGLDEEMRAVFAIIAPKLEAQDTVSWLVRD
jgi:23S rRNA (adenine2030-N6)-methyltransferase